MNQSQIATMQRVINTLRDQLDEIARHEIDRSIEIGRIESVVEIACASSFYRKRRRDEFRSAMGRAWRWFRD